MTGRRATQVTLKQRKQWKDDDNQEEKDEEEEDEEEEDKEEDKEEYEKEEDNEEEDEEEDEDEEMKQEKTHINNFCIGNLAQIQRKNALQFESNISSTENPLRLTNLIPFKGHVTYAYSCTPSLV